MPHSPIDRTQMRIAVNLWHFRGGVPPSSSEARQKPLQAVGKTPNFVADMQRRLKKIGVASGHRRMPKKQADCRSGASEKQIPKKSA